MKMHFNIRLLIKLTLLTILCSAKGYAQFSTPTSLDYLFSTSTTGSLALDANNNSVNMSTGTQQLIGSYQDDAASVVTNIGFDYVFMGKTYRKFSVSSNGILALGDTAIYRSAYNLNLGKSTKPLLSAFATDLSTGPLGKVHSKLIGVAPNRCLVVEYLNMSLYFYTSTPSNDATFQIRLYENTGMIEYVYGAMSVSRLSDETIGIGFYAGSFSNNIISNFSSIDFRTHSNTTGPTYIQNNFISTMGAISSLNSAVNGNRRTYLLTPKTYNLNLPTNFYVSSADIDFVTLEWDMPSPTTGITGFSLYRSTDNNTFEHIEDLTSLDYMGTAATSLSPSTNYYWRIYTLFSGCRTSNYISLTSTTLGGTFMGWKTIGNVDADYTSITAALQDAQLQGIGGQAILSLQADYSSTNETFPISFNYINGLNINSSIFIQPAVPGISITSNNPTATIDFNGGNYFVIDGRVNGTGNTPSLVIENTSTTGGGSAIRFINDASQDTVKFCNLKSVYSANNTGVIVFSTANGNNNNRGNDHIVIHSNNIDGGAENISSPSINTAAYHGIYATGNASINLYNSENTIANNNIFNFYSPNSLSTGINILAGNSSWTIIGNSFYQTSTREISSASAKINVINISSIYGNNFNISNNYIGGSSANALGSAWIVTSNNNTTFKGISVEVQEGGMFSNVNGNYIKNINFSSNALISAGGVFCGIYFNKGNANIGTESGNIIGSSTGTGSITVMNSKTSAYSYGICLESYYSNFNISNNSIGSITILGSSNDISHNFCGIYFSTGDSATIYRNTIGSLSTANSINLATPSTSTSRQLFTGISCSRLIHVKENTVANINNAYLPNTAISSTTVYGIYVNGNEHSDIISNSIRNLKSASNANGTVTGASVIGIYSSGNNEKVIGNTVHSLFNTNTNPGISVIGLCNTSIASNTLISKNNIHSISNASASDGNIYGVYSSNSNTTVQNNMIRLGIDDQGNSIQSAQNIRGIYEEQGNNSYYHNTVYIGGTSVTSGITNTYAFYSGDTTNTKEIKNNIFVNNRSNSSGTGLNVAYFVAGKLPSITGLTSNNNIYFANGTGGISIRNSTTNYTLSTWRNASGLDFLSHQSNPNFINANGNSTTGDLHIQGKTSAEGNGSYIASVSDDYDGNVRSNLSPSDIGADAGTFINQDGSPPIINFIPLTNGTASNRTLSNYATITDNIGISNTYKPRLYFKKSTDANAFTGNTSTDNGWKYVIASNSTSPYSFNINYSILFGGTVSNGTIIEYFVAAQDDSNNMSSYPDGAISNANPPLANINVKPSTVYSYNIYTSTIGGTINVGTGQTYTSLTGAGGAFEAINTKIVTQDITLNITSNLNEDGSNSLNELSENLYLYGYGVRIKSSNSTMKIISGTNVPDGVPMINFNGTDNVSIDGHVGFGGPYLTFRNTKTDSNKTGPVIQFTNGSSECMLFKCIIESNANSSTIGAVNIGNSGNNVIEINECKIRAAQGGTVGKPKIGIYSNSNNNLLSIIGNEISDFSSFGILLHNVADSSAIVSNSIFSADTSYSSITCISIQSGNNHTISTNYIGGTMPDASGVWLTKGSGTFKGITTAGSTLVANSIHNNYIRGIELTGNNKSDFMGIEVSSGKANIGNAGGNFIGNSYSPIINSGDTTTTGILISSNDEINVYNNSITSLYANGTGSKVSLKGIHYCGNGSPTISLNYISDLKSYGSSTDHDSLVSVCGILSNNLSKTLSISKNQINNLSALNPTASTQCMSISVSTTNNTYDNWCINTIAKNNIYGLTNISTNSLSRIYGIYLFKGNPVFSFYNSICNVHNNMISLNNDTNHNGTILKGIYSRNLNLDIDSILYNSIKIGGNSTGNSNSFCYEINDDSKLFLKNNIFINQRTATSGKHYSFGKTSVNPSTNWIGANSDYNLFYCSNTATTAYWNGDKTFADFKNNSGSNANSSNVNVNFIDESIGDLHITGNSINDTNLAGIPISIVSDDYDGDPRPIAPVHPYMGADELTFFPLPITLLSFYGYDDENNIQLFWESSSEIYSNYFEIEKLSNEKIFEKIGQVKAIGRSNEINKYSFIDKQISKENKIEYYRLKLIDINNSYKYSDVIAIKRNNSLKSTISIFPNPTTENINIFISNMEELNLKIRVMDVMGKVVYEDNTLIGNQINTISLNHLPSGVYTLQINGLKENNTWKVIKK